MSPMYISTWLKTKIIELYITINDFILPHYRTRMANSALKCRIIILITARSLCSYNNILIII